MPESDPTSGHSGASAEEWVALRRKGRCRRLKSQPNMTLTFASIFARVTALQELGSSPLQHSGQSQRLWVRMRPSNFVLSLSCMNPQRVQRRIPVGSPSLPTRVGSVVE